MTPEERAAFVANVRPRSPQKVDARAAQPPREVVRRVAGRRRPLLQGPPRLTSMLSRRSPETPRRKRRLRRPARKGPARVRLRRLRAPFAAMAENTLLKYFFSSRCGHRPGRPVPPEPQDAHAPPAGDIRHPAQAPLPAKASLPKSSAPCWRIWAPASSRSAQTLSTRSEILPKAYSRRIGEAADGVRTVAVRGHARRRLTAIYGAQPGATSSTPSTPRLWVSASLAQVHKARLVNGDVVAVKIQRPGVKATMAQDIDIMRMVARQASRFHEGRADARPARRGGRAVGHVLGRDGLRARGRQLGRVRPFERTAWRS